MRIGFVGTGVITKAIVQGVLRSKFPFKEISLSPRNARTAAELAGLDPRINVADSNQHVVDNSDLVCIAVIPQVVKEVLGQLAFKSHHHVVTFVPGTSIERLHKLVHPAIRLARAIPLPAVADGQGCTAIFPPDEVVSSLFSSMGKAVQVEDERQFDALHAVTATMASFYAVLEHQAAWLKRQGLPYPSARAFLSGYCVGLAHETTQTDQSFNDMIEYLMTPGGLNEQVHAELSARGVYDYSDSLDRILARVQCPT
jgi:pyrroline-5-carboxylate reductase